MSNPYKILGLTNNATAAEIKAAFLLQAKQSHPDMKPNDPTAGKRFAEVNAAYKELTDPDRKARIDAMLRGDYPTYSDPQVNWENLDERVKEAWQRSQKEDWADPLWRQKIKYTRIHPDFRQQPQDGLSRGPVLVALLLFLITIQFMSGAYQQGTANIIEKRMTERQLMRDRRYPHRMDADEI